MASNRSTMDDVDRLFACFKCGVSPPQSAVRERKRSKSMLEQGSSNCKVSAKPCFLSPGSAGQEQNNPLTTTNDTSKESDMQSSIEKLKAAVTKAKSFSRGKQFSPVVFYGSPQGVPPKRPTSLLRLLHEIRLDLSKQNKLNIRKDVWVTFPKQDEALKFAKTHEHVHVFSYQDHFSGQRRFLVSTYAEFWQRYKNMNSKFRHHYEVIKEGSPCHLYFDLEFSKKVNMENDGNEMVDLLMSVILEALDEKYSIRGNQDWIVELDSSTEEKFSRHLIIHIPKTSFKDNSHAGAFVSEWSTMRKLSEEKFLLAAKKSINYCHSKMKYCQICSRIQNGRAKDRRFEKLFVKRDSSSTESSSQLFVDTAVYSRNRCFRLPLSSKAGKSSVLLPTGRFMCKDMGEEDMFMASLICNMDVDCEKLLVCTTDLDCVKTLHYDTEVNFNIGNHQYRQHLPEFTLNSCASDVSRTYLMGKSPFPFLDKFVESVASVGKVSGKIRSWYWFSEYGLMVYSMSKNRYCERIGRQHKSNHVIYVVDLRMAVYYQKCHDPDCRGYRSPLRPVPVDLIPNPSVSKMVYQQPVDDDHGHHLVNEEQNFPFDDDNNADGSKDSWWLEAVKVVEDVENMQKKMETSTMEVIDEEDDEWWMAVERTASQAELTYLS